MANKEHLEILNKGVDGWNQWRTQNPLIRPDLHGADLNRFILSNADFRGCNLQRADLRWADLSWASLRGANLSEANLYLADLTKADLNLADLTNAILTYTDLNWADLTNADLTNANLSKANLVGVTLRGANLIETDFQFSIIGVTIFADVDLHLAKVLTAVSHIGPSSIGIDTIYRSEGKVPEVFLRGAGVPETLITYINSLSKEAINYYSCFISYSSLDQSFAERLHTDLQNKGVRCWFAPEDIKTGDKIRQRIDKAIRFHEKLLLILSKNSIQSDWVEKEVETAFEEEGRRNKLVLFPVRLDNSVMETDQAWAADIRRTRQIGNFRDAKNHDEYQIALEKLLRDLKG